MSVDLIFNLLSIAAVGIGQYAAIRADLLGAKLTAAAAAKSADECHSRLDRHIEVKH